jgi:hypothetical protein
MLHSFLAVGPLTSMTALHGSSCRVRRTVTMASSTPYTYFPFGGPVSSRLSFPCALSRRFRHVAKVSSRRLVFLVCSFGGRSARNRLSQAHCHAESDALQAFPISALSLAVSSRLPTHGVSRRVRTVANMADDRLFWLHRTHMTIRNISNSRVRNLYPDNQRWLPFYETAYSNFRSDFSHGPSAVLCLWIFVVHENRGRNSLVGSALCCAYGSLIVFDNMMLFVLEGQGAVSHDPRTAGSRISYTLFFCTH